MKISEIYYSPRFFRSLKKIPDGLKGIMDERIDIFKNNCFDPRLKTHKLSGKRKHFWSFSITFSQRIMFRFIDKGRVDFVDIGGHNIYD